MKTFHHEGQHLEYALRGIGADDIARGFVGVVVNSNFANACGESSLEESAEETLARYVRRHPGRSSRDRRWAAQRRLRR